MKRAARRILFALALIAVSLIVLMVVFLPPRAAESPAATRRSSAAVVRGAYHVHSSGSDGTGSIDEIAAAASRAGLQFVIVTDHGDGTRAAPSPSYRSGVLCVSGVEVSTSHGHYVALGLSQTPYRLAGHPRDVIEDVKRFGGFGVAAHPDSNKAALRWDDWEAPFDGLEWLNGDSEWRDEFWTSLGRVLLTYAVRPAETLVTLLDRPTQTLARWDRVAQSRRVFGLAGADAHARLGYRQSSEPYNDVVLARLPSYEASFRAFANYVLIDAQFSGDADRDARSLLGAIHEGRAFTAVEGIARLGAFDVTARSGSAVARPGEYLESAGSVTLDGAVTGPPATTIVVLRDGTPIAQSNSGTIHVDVGSQPAAYRVEAHLPNAMRPPNVPWLLANPIYVNLRSVHASRAPTPLHASAAERTPVRMQEVNPESSPNSTSEVAKGSTPDGAPGLIWQVRLGNTPAPSQFSAITFPPPAQTATPTGVEIRARADRDIRLWVQLRLPGQRGGERWLKSFHIGPELETIHLDIADFLPAGSASSPHPPFGEIDRLLLVVDTLNTLPGTTATISVAGLWFVR